MIILHPYQKERRMRKEKTHVFPVLGQKIYCRNLSSENAKSSIEKLDYVCYADLRIKEKPIPPKPVRRFWSIIR